MLMKKYKLLILFASFCFISCSNNKFKENPSGVFEDFKNNEISAKEKYKDTFLEFTGELDISIIDTNYYRLSISNQIEKDWKGVSCFFDDSYKEKFLNLKNGDIIKLKGIYAEYNSFLHSIKFKNCSIEVYK